MKLLFTLYLWSTLFSSALLSQTQTDQQLHELYSHFAGIWIGKHEDYTGRVTVETPLRMVITEDTKKRVLRLEYFYGTKGQKSFDHSVRFMAIDPGASIVTLNWKHDSKEQYKAEALNVLLNTGYGDLKFSGTPNGDTRTPFWRAVFHLSSDHLSYSWEKSSDNVTFYKTADWILARESVVGVSVVP